MSTALTPSNSYQFPPEPAPAILTRAIWDAVLGSVAERLRALEAQRTDLEDLINDLSFNGQARIDAAITPLIDAQKKELSDLRAALAVTVGENDKVIVELRARVDAELKKIGDDIDRLQTRVDTILAGGVPAADVQESAARVFVTPAQKAEIATLRTDLEQGLAGKLSNNFQAVKTTNLANGAVTRAKIAVEARASQTEAQNLSGDGLITAALLAEAFGSNATVYVDEFLNSGVWTKRKNAALVFVEGLGAGQGGAPASAQRLSGFVISSGGASGAGGEWCEAMFFANELPEIVNVEIGAKGIGARYNNNTVVSARTPGGDTKFGAFMTAAGGGSLSTVNGMLRETSTAVSGGNHNTNGAGANTLGVSGRKTGKAGGAGGGGAAQGASPGGNGGVRTSTAVRAGDIPASGDNPPLGGTSDNVPGADGVRLGDGGGGGARGLTADGTRGGNGARGGGGGGAGAPVYPSSTTAPPNYSTAAGDGGDGWLRVTTIVLRRF